MGRRTDSGVTLLIRNDEVNCAYTVKPWRVTLHGLHKQRSAVLCCQFLRAAHCGTTAATNGKLDAGPAERRRAGAGGG